MPKHFIFVKPNYVFVLKNRKISEKIGKKSCDLNPYDFDTHITLVFALWLPRKVFSLVIELN